MIIALGGLIGFAAFSTDGSVPTTTVTTAEVPADAEARIAAAALVAMLQGSVSQVTPTMPPTTAPADPAPTTPAPTTAPPTTAATETTPAPPEASAAAAAAASPPATTTTAAPTTTAPPPTTAAPTTTTTTQPPPTTQPPVQGGPRDVGTWRPLVTEHFPPERVDEALAIIHCESKGDPTAVNPYSGASGLFQFLSGTWEWASAEAGWAGASVFDPEANIASAAWLVQTSIDTGHPRGPWGHWTCSPG
jgi:hypothetical protein